MWHFLTSYNTEVNSQNQCIIKTQQWQQHQQTNVSSVSALILYTSVSCSAVRSNLLCTRTHLIYERKWNERTWWVTLPGEHVGVKVFVIIAFNHNIVNLVGWNLVYHNQNVKIVRFSIIFSFMLDNRFSSQERREGSSPSRTWNASQFSATSVSSAGSTPRRK